MYNIFNIYFSLKTEYFYSKLLNIYYINLLNRIYFLFSKKEFNLIKLNNR